MVCGVAPLKVGIRSPLDTRKDQMILCVLRYWYIEERMRWMSSPHAIPILLSILVGAVLGLVVWGLQRTRSHVVGDSVMGTRGDVLLGLLVLAAFALGVFLTYVLTGFNF
jgi:hypothetical protein